MIAMDKVKSGMVTSISVVLLASALLALTYAIAHYSNSNEETASRLAEMESVSLQFDSAAWGIRSLERSGAINVSAKYANSTTNLTFSENMSSLNRYSNDLSHFSDFLAAYSQEANVSLDISRARLSPMLLYVSPQNITVNHSAGRVGFEPQAGPGVLGYEIQITVPLQLSDSLAWDSQANGSGEDALPVGIARQGSNGAWRDNCTLSRSSNSIVRLVDSANNTIATMQFRPAAALDVFNYNLTNDLYISVIVKLNGSVGGVELGKDIITVGRGGIVKQGKVLVYAG